jgi:glycosyltransferase involved in cell wall biosynthesis
MMARLPKVLICAYIVDRDDVSEAQMAYEWISRLSQHIDLIVVTAGSRMHETCGLEGNSRIQLEIVKPRVSFQRWDAFDRFAHPGYVDFFLAARKRIRSLMMRQSIELAHHLTPQALRYPSPLAGLGIAFVAGPYHGGLQPPPVMKELQGQEGAFYYLRKLDTLRMRYDPLLRAHFREAKRIVISAPYVLQHLPQYADKCSVIPGTAMNAVEQQTDASRTPMRMMFVGKLEPSKGVELLVNALARVKRSDWTLDIFGEGSQGALYRELSERTGLGQKIYWHGFVPNATVLDAYLHAQAFVFPSLKEPTGGALLEAMASGVPVVCVDSGGPAFAITDSCGVKIALSTKEQMVDDLARAIDRLLDSPKLRQQLGNQARQRFLNEFTWERVVDKMLRLYDATLGTPLTRLGPSEAADTAARREGVGAEH